MYKYVLKRLLMLIPVIIGVTFIVFFILNLSPGDPAAIIHSDRNSNGNYFRQETVFHDG